MRNNLVSLLVSLPKKDSPQLIRYYFDKLTDVLFEQLFVASSEKKAHTEWMMSFWLLMHCKFVLHCRI